MTRSIVLFTLMIATVASANDQNLEFMDFKVRNNENVWTYSVTCLRPVDSLVVQLEIPRAAYVKQVSRATEYSLKKRGVTSTKKDSLEEKKRVTPKMEYSLQQERLKDGNLQIKFDPLDSSNQTFTFEVIAPKNMTKNGVIDWAIETDAANGTVPGPTVLLDDPSFFRPAITVGSNWRCDDYIDFKIENNVMLIENDSRMRPLFGIGGLLKIGNIQKKPLDLLISIELGKDSTKVIDSFVLGLGLRMNRHLNLYAGVLVHGGQAVSPGFKDVAEQLVTDIKDMKIEAPSAMEKDSTHIDYKAIQKGFRFENLEKLEDYDGFPIIDPRNEKPIFPGPPLINSTNWAFVFGVALSFDVVKRIDLR